MKLKTKRKAAASSQKYRGKQSYGIGGAVMTLGKNLLQGKKLGSGAFKGVLRAGITPGSGIGAGIGLAGALASKSKNPSLQKLGKGLGIAGNVAGMLNVGGGGLKNIGAMLKGSGSGGFGSGGFGSGGFDVNPNSGAAAGGLMASQQAFLERLDKNPNAKYAYGGKMKVMKEGGKMYDEGGEVEKEPPSVDSLLEALNENDKRALNQLLRGEQRRLDKEYRIDMRTPEVDSEEGDLEEGYDYTEGSEAKERMMKLIKGGGLGLGAISVASLAPLIYKLLKKKKDPIDSNAQYHNILDPMPGPRDPFFRQPNQSARGRGQ